MTLDILKLGLTEREMPLPPGLGVGEPLSLTEVRFAQAIARAQLAKALAGVVAWLERVLTERKPPLLPEAWSQWAAVQAELRQAARAAGLEWPKEGE